MAEATERYIIGKGRKWLQSNRPDKNSPFAYLFSQYLYDAKEYMDARDAKREAKKTGGDVWAFVRATGKCEMVWANPRKKPGPVCGNCKWYAGYDGECKRGGNRKYWALVSVRDSCGNWEARHEQKR